MTFEFDMKRYVQDVLEGYDTQKKIGLLNSLGRYIGALECCLCILGVLGPGKPIPKKEVPNHSFDFLGLNEVFKCFGTGKRMETYSECIVRLAKEWLESQDGN